MFLQSPDNSNAQYGLLGVWSGAEAGAEVPRQYWLDVERHWRGEQLPSGGWSYGGMAASRGESLSMTSGGVASLAVTHDYLHAQDAVSNFAKVSFPKELAAGLAWLEQGDRA